MFGNKKKLSQEEIQKLQDTLEEGKKLVEDFARCQEVLASDNEAIQKSREQMESDVDQAADHSREILEWSRMNATSAEELATVLEEKKQEAQTAYANYQEVCGQIEALLKDSQQAVEQNKHFTSPSKAIGDIPGELRTANQSYLEELDAMGDYGKQMSVLSLNAAIEAGRMGESGRGFVNAAEEVRGYARQYERSVTLLKEKITQSERKIDKMEESIHHIISLLKENNVATTKLMREAEKINKSMDGTMPVDLVEALESIKENVLAMKNHEDEIIKAEERNQIQFEDIKAEIENQQNDGDEMFMEWGNLYQSAVAYKEKL